MTYRLSRGWLNLTGVNGLNPWEAEKIRLVQREDVDQPIRLHDGGEPRVMHFRTLHTVGNYQLTPDGINPIIIWQERHGSFHLFNASLGFSYGEAKAVSLRGAGTNVPELGDILQGKVLSRALPVHIFQNRFDQLMQRVFFPEEFEEDVCVDQIAIRLGHQS
jgi:hypothetical protein